jgi:hypothetical protein
LIDVDDAFGTIKCDDAKVCHAELIHSPSVTIDIEQTAFKSPQHVAWIKLDVESQKQKQQVHLQLTSKFHIRYPFPLQVLGERRLDDGRIAVATIEFWNLSIGWRRLEANMACQQSTIR